jgi:hypothetical protein
MWCSTCQQDVPGLDSPADGALRCSRCAEAVASASHADSPASGDFANTSHLTKASAADNRALEKLLHSAPLGEDDWQLEAELRGVHRMFQALKSRPSVGAEAADSSIRRAIEAESDSTPHSSDSPVLAQQPRGHAAAWTILCLGLSVFACGGVLLGLSLAAQRDDLWPIGMPLALIGQAGLILGLILQLDGLWHTSRKTAAVLSQLDGELKNVRRATTLVSSAPIGGGQSFHPHQAEVASPNFLLVDLKGRMDLLARQMARQEN